VPTCRTDLAPLAGPLRRDRLVGDIDVDGPPFVPVVGRRSSGARLLQHPSERSALGRRALPLAAVPPVGSAGLVPAVAEQLDVDAGNNPSGAGSAVQPIAQRDDR